MTKELKTTLQEGLVDMRKRYLEDLDRIREMEENLSQLVLVCYDRLNLYIQKQDKSNLEEMIDLEYDIIRKASQIESFSYDLLALQQPVASDLRFLQMSIKLASSYKRIGNHLARSAEILLDFSVRSEEKEIIQGFIETQKDMVENSTKAFVNGDNNLALQTIEKDKENNELFSKSIEYLVELTKADHIKPKELSEKVLFYKYFERLGDSLAKIADFASRL